MSEESSVFYGKEPFDLRLTVLRLIRCLPFILGITLLGTLMFGGSYYLDNVLFRTDSMYAATSTYRVSFAEEPSKAGDYYINEMTWNTYVTSKEFRDAVWEHLQEDTDGDIVLYLSSAEGLSNMLEAKLASDIHVPSTIVTTGSEKFAEVIAQAVEETMTEEFAESNEQVAAIEVIDPALEAQKVVPDVRPVRAFVLSGILSFFFAIVFFLLRELSNHGIWLPSTFRTRYGLKAVGTINSPELKSNMEHFLGDKTRIAIYAVDDFVYLTEVIEVLEEKLADGSDKKREWVQIPVLCPAACERIRDTEGLFVVVKAGKEAATHFDYHLEYLAAQDTKVDAVLLWDADEWLIRTYYKLPNKGVYKRGKWKGKKWKDTIWKGNVWG